MQTGPQQPLADAIASAQLPSLPAVALEVIALVQKPDLDVSELAEAITNDPALASKILKMANSSFYAQAHRVGTISRAIILLGLNDLRALALSFSLVDGLRTSNPGGFDHDAFWRRSLIAATAARSIARRAGHGHVEEAFLGGLLCRIGVLALSGAIAERYDPLSNEAGSDYRRLRELEAAALGFTHADAGERLAEQWQLPASLVAAIYHVDSPESASDDVGQFVRLVAAGDRAALLLNGADGDALERYRDCCSQWFDIPAPAADLLLAEIDEAARGALALFDLPSSRLPTAAQILARANNVLTELSFEMSHERARLQVENLTLSEQASTDPLTGLANRRHLVEFAEEQMSIATRSRDPLSLVFLDLDHFKSVNDHFGHQMGDRILQLASLTIGRAARGTDLVARYGGDEFAIVMPGTALADGESAAELVREAVANAKFTLDDGTSITLTVTAGVASFDRDNDDLKSLLGRAGAGIYQAKLAGGNCVVATESQQAA